MKSRNVTVRVPGSTSNLGSGFDTLGLALTLYNQVRVTRVPGKGPVAIRHSPGIDRRKTTNLVQSTFRLFFRRTGLNEVGIEVELSGDVPVGRGLGASATARLGLLVALNRLTRAGLESDALLRLAFELEGHPDNASPALYGGFTVSGVVGDQVRCLRYPVDRRVSFVTLIPEFEVDTGKARQLIPNSFSKADAAHSLNRTALIAAAFATHDYQSLGGLFDDRFHQPYREQLVPGLSRVIQAGVGAGAIGGWLSGSGSAIICMTVRDPRIVVERMQAVMPGSAMMVLVPSNTGAEIVEEADPPTRLGRFGSAPRKGRFASSSPGT